MKKKIAKIEKLNKSICFKCHMKECGVDGTNSAKFQCYPPLNENDRKECEYTFEKEWKEGKVWCYGLQHEATDRELKKMLGSELPFINPKSKPTKFCYYKKEHKIKEK